MYDVLDEVDQLLSCKHQLVYAWGKQQQLSCLPQRMHILQAALHALCSPEVAEVLANSAIANVHKHRGRYGSMPAVRLLQGTALSIRCFVCCQCMNVGHTALYICTVRCCAGAIRSECTVMQQPCFSDRASDTAER